jgi:hypothetical protein
MHKYQYKMHGMRVSESESECSSMGTTPTTSSMALSSQQVPMFEFKTEISNSRVGDEYYFISNLLNKAALLSVKCKKAIEGALDLINAKHVVTVTDEEDEAK